MLDLKIVPVEIGSINFFFFCGEGVVRPTLFPAPD